MMATDIVSAIEHSANAAPRARLYPGISFITLKKRSPLHELNLFDVPSERFGDGNLTGIKMVRELLENLPQDGPQFVIADALRAAVAAEVEDVAHDRTGGSRRGAAVGFIDALCAVLLEAAPDRVHRPVIEAMIQDHDESTRQDLMDLQTENAGTLHQHAAVA